jgi:hypothetical protein
MNIKLSLCLIKQHAMKTSVRVEINLHHSWPRHWMEVIGQLHAPAAVPQGKLRAVPIGQEAGWATEPVWTLWSRETSVVYNS